VSSIGRIVRHHWPMRIADFALERFFARWEFAVEHLLCASDVEAYPMAELVSLADDQTRACGRVFALATPSRRAIPSCARRSASLYETIAPDEVLTFAGAEEAIFCLMNVIAGTGDQVIVTSPAYQSLYEVAHANGADVTLHELREARAWAIDLDALRAQVTPATRLIVGQPPAQPDRDACRSGDVRCGSSRSREEAGAHLLVDEVYRGLEVDAGDQLPTGADSTPRGISLGVMSKSFAMPGLRIGWIATHDRALLDGLARFKGLHDHLLRGTLGDPRDHRSPVAGPRPARSRSIVLANLERLDAFFDEWGDRF
jgi:hypothetical protein